MDKGVQEWSLPALPLHLPFDEVHVWRAPLEVSPTGLQRLSALLSADEQTRASKFHFLHHAQHFVVAHAVLRLLLALYLRTEPTELLFLTNSYGKPMLLPSLNPLGLCFNISHSQDMALFAFAYRRELGVDIEYARRGIDYNQLARYCFSPYEQQVLHSLTTEEARHEAFYLCWTRKEAYIKARGLGLSLALDLFDVSLLPSEPVCLLASRESPDEISRWSLRALSPGSGYMGAIVAEGQQWSLRSWQWSSDSERMMGL